MVYFFDVVFWSENFVKRLIIYLYYDNLWVIEIVFIFYKYLVF